MKRFDLSKFNSNMARLKGNFKDFFKHFISSLDFNMKNPALQRLQFGDEDEREAEALFDFSLNHSL